MSVVEKWKCKKSKLCRVSSAVMQKSTLSLRGWTLLNLFFNLGKHSCWKTCYCIIHTKQTLKPTKILKIKRWNLPLLSLKRIAADALLFRRWCCFASESISILSISQSISFLSIKQAISVSTLSNKLNNVACLLKSKFMIGNLCYQ